MKEKVKDFFNYFFSKQMKKIGSERKNYTTKKQNKKGNVLNRFLFKVSGIVQAIKVAMRTQIDQLSWMTPSTKRGAYSKLDNLAVNIAYPDWVLNDTLLAQYYEVNKITRNFSL